MRLNAHNNYNSTIRNRFPVKTTTKNKQTNKQTNKNKTKQNKTRQNKTKQNTNKHTTTITQAKEKNCEKKSFRFSFQVRNAGILTQYKEVRRHYYELIVSPMRHRHNVFLDH